MSDTHISKIKIATWNIEDSRGTQNTHVSIENRIQKIASALNYNVLKKNDIILLQELHKTNWELISDKLNDLKEFLFFSKPYNPVDKFPMELIILVRKSLYTVKREMHLQYGETIPNPELSFLNKRGIYGLQLESSSQKSFWVFNSHMPLFEEEKWHCIKEWQMIFSKINEPILFGLDTNFFYDLQGSEMYIKVRSFLEDATKYTHSYSFIDEEMSEFQGYTYYRSTKAELSGSFFGYTTDSNQKKLNFSHGELNGLTKLDRIFYRCDSKEKSNLKLVESGCGVNDSILGFLEMDKRLNVMKVLLIISFYIVNLHYNLLVIKRKSRFFFFK